jgi:hypothetical protein
MFNFCVGSALEPLFCVDFEGTTDVSEVYPAPVFRVEVSMVDEGSRLYTVLIFLGVLDQELTYKLFPLLTGGAEPFLRSRQLCSYSRTSQHFMEPEGTLLSSHEPSTVQYPEPH